MRFGKLSYGMELPPYRYRLPGNFRRANIYVQSRLACERALATATKFIEETLKLRVNRDKSGVFRPGRAKFLGYTFWRWKPVAHPKSIDRLKKLKAVFFRARGSSRLATIKRLNMILRG